jgi:DNA modification methylase
MGDLPPDRRRRFDNSIIAGDSRAVLAAMAPESVDMVITSPPYNFKMDYDSTSDDLPIEQYFKELLEPVWKECYRVVKRGGRIAVVVQPMYDRHVPTHHRVARQLEDAGFSWRSEIVWDKANVHGEVSLGSVGKPSSPYMRSTMEFIEILDKIDRKKWPDPDLEQKIGPAVADITRGEYIAWTDSRWNIPPPVKGMKKYGHPAMFPEEVPKRLAKLFTYVGDTIIDPFGGCYDDKTEIMTKQRGFVRFDELNPDDKVASLVDGRLEFVAPLRHFKYQYTGEMYRVKGRSIDLLVTPNHNLYCKEYHQESFGLVPVSDVKWKTIHFKSTCDWNGECREWFELPESSRSMGGKNRVSFKVDPIKRIKMDDWLEFLGYFISEGSTTKYNRGIGLGFEYVVQIKQNEGFKKDIIRECLHRLPFHITENYQKFRIHNKQLYDYLSIFGKSKDKFIPSDIKALGTFQLEILVRALILGDGCIDGSRLNYYTVSPRLRDDMCEIMLKIGYSPSIFAKKYTEHSIIINNKNITFKSDNIQYAIRSKKSDNIKLHLDINFNKQSYFGFVYCVEVPSHVIYVRRNGKCAWCGNSGTTALSAWKNNRHFISIDVSEKYSKIAARRVRHEALQQRLIPPVIAMPIPVLVRWKKPA